MNELADLSAADVDQLLGEISPLEPCGANLEYDPIFLELEQAVKGKPEVQYGGTITPEIPPDWKSVKALSLQLLARSHDLRIALPLSRALLKTQGMTGFSAGLTLVERLLATRWESLHPQLDPSDDNDPMLRINTLAALCESSTMLRDVRETILIGSRAHGRFSLRDIDIVTGELDMPKGEEKLTLAVIDAAFLDVDLSEFEETYRAVAHAYDSSVRIEQVLTEKVGVAQALDLSALAKMLKRARDFMHERLSRRTAVAEPADAVVPELTEGQTMQANTPSPPRSGEISNRDDVVQMLDKICAYYAKHEPSSPIPLLLQRAQKLASKSFVEILQDLAPDGLNQVYQISGVKKDT
jgi:type VI secretion system protein ImpA